MTTTKKKKHTTLLLDLIEEADGTRLRKALAAYEATGDHDHGRGPLRPGAPCNGFLDQDCWVKRARAVLAAIDAVNAR